MKKFEVSPDGDGIVSVRHGFGTEDVRVRCLRADGSGVGYRYFMAIGPDEIDLVTVPGSGVVFVEVEPGRPDQ